MIYGIGTDIIRVRRIAASLQRFGDRFVQRILTEAEQADFVRSARPAHFLARRFAAKEAAVKALGLGISNGLGFRQIGIGHDERGRPRLEYSGRAAALCRELGIAASHVSLSDEHDYAIAYVMLECSNSA